MTTVSVIGAGAVGTSIARRLRFSGFQLECLVCRTLASARRAARIAGGGRPSIDAAAAARAAEWVVIALPDPQIAEVCRNIAATGGFAHRPWVLHLSGASGWEALSAARKAGARVGAAHPLASFPDRNLPPESFDGIHWGVSAPKGELRGVAAFVRRLGGRPIPISFKGRPLYHAAAVFASNHAVVQWSLAAFLLSRAGLDRPAALRALLPLAEGTIANVKRRGLPGAITGPASRGDLATIRKHLAALARLDPDLSAMYRLCAKEAVRLGLAKGSISRSAASRVLHTMSGTVVHE